jgi:hypothetical protein
MESLEKRQLLATNPLIIGGKSFDAALHVAVDSAGNRVVAGIFSGTVDFDPGAGTAKLTAKGETDLYIAKYTSENALVWAHQYGGAAGEIEEEHLYDTSQATVGDFENRASPTFEGTGEYVNALVVGSDNSIVFGGSYQGTMDFDPLSDTRGNVKSGGYQDGFVCKLDADGSTLWFSTIAGVFNDVVKSIAIDGNSNVAVTGYFTRSADFNPTKKTYRIDAIGRDDVFVWKLFGSTGSLDWAVSAGGDAVDLRDRDAGEGIAVDSSNNLFVTGSFAGEVDFAPGTGSFYVEAIEKTDGFIWVLSPKGKFDRVQTFGGEKWDSGNRIAIDAAKNVYVAGYFTEEADLDPTSTVQNFIAADDSDYDGVEVDIFALRQDVKGNTQWITQLKGDGFEYLGDMTVDASQVSISGGYAGRLQVGASTPSISVEGADDFEDHNSRDFSYDAFLVALSAPKGAFVGISAFGSASDDYAVGVAAGSILTGRFKGTVDFGTGNRKSNGQDDGFLLEI